MKCQAVIGSDRIDCDLDLDSWPQVRATIGGRVLEVRLSEIGRDRYWFTLAGRSVEATVVASSDDVCIVRIGNETFPVEVADRRRNRRAGLDPAGGHREIRAPMPGRVIEVLVPEGSTVEPNQGLFVLEAMKMQNELKAPRHGTLRSVRVRDGMSVNAGDILGILE